MKELDVKEDKGWFLAVLTTVLDNPVVFGILSWTLFPSLQALGLRPSPQPSPTPSSREREPNHLTPRKARGEILNPPAACGGGQGGGR